ncbi:uncharacterized protein LODBEIA_P14500 [Lodderomyces beijingensis]|uniref:Decapping nuclease n=1 Tax=Lodderomyces beijingensis TaxID=1775926 RepID=A0ABP0ZGC2_9ASCO
MLDDIKLSIFENIINRDSGGDELLQEILDCNHSFTQSPSEICYFTKDGDELKFNDTAGLDVIGIPIGASTSTNKRSSKKTSSQSYEPIVGARLTEGFDAYTHPSLDQIYSLEDLFKALKHQVSSGKLSLKDLKFITLRRHLQKLMNVPLNKQPIQFNVIYWNGLIFFIYDWEAEDAAQNEEDQFLRMLQYSGFRFEKVLTRSDTESKYYTVVNHKVGDTPVTYSAEIDCGIDKCSGLDNYVELKTHFKVLDDRLRTLNKLHRKLMSLYCQNKFVSCEHSVIGFRTADFNLASVKKYTDLELKGLLRSSPIFLTHGCLINTRHIFQWYNLVIRWISERKIIDTEPKIFTLCFERAEELMDSKLSLKPVNPAESNRIFNNSIPKWFQDFIKHK